MQGSQIPPHTFTVPGIRTGAWLKAKEMAILLFDSSLDDRKLPYLGIANIMIFKKEGRHVAVSGQENQNQAGKYLILWPGKSLFGGGVRERPHS